MDQTRFARRLDQGRVFEVQISKWLQAQGWHVTPLYLMGGIDRETPRALGTPPLVLPDLLACKDGRCVWLEAKAKGRMRDYPATGFDRRLFEDYLALQRASGFPVFLVFKDGESVYGNLLDQAARHIYSEDFIIQGKAHVLFRVPEAFTPFRRGVPFEEYIPATLP